MKDRQEVDRGALYKGFGASYSRAMELALTPVLFGGLGWVLDRVLGTSPLLLVVLGILGMVGVFLRLYYRYDTDMKAEESRLQAAGGRGPLSPDWEDE